eukprot:6207195-Pleurochrysis_carterae.AAC.1
MAYIASKGGAAQTGKQCRSGASAKGKGCAALLGPVAGGLLDVQSGDAGRARGGAARSAPPALQWGLRR